VAEVQVGLATVVGHEYLTVLERVHGARIDIDVRIQLLDHDPEATLLEEPSEGCCGEALAERTRHAPRHEDVFRHGGKIYPEWAGRARSQPEIARSEVTLRALRGNRRWIRGSGNMTTGGLQQLFGMAAGGVAVG